MPRHVLLLVAATLALALPSAPLAAAAPVCAGLSTGATCIGAYVIVPTESQFPVPIATLVAQTYVCVGVYNAGTGHCTGAQLP